MKYLMIIFLLLNIISCNNNKNNEIIPDENIEYFQDDVIDIENLNNLIPSHAILLNSDVYDINWRRTSNINRGNIIEIIGLQKMNDGTWYKIKTRSNVIGWGRSDSFLDISDIDLSEISMNKIDLKNINVIDDKNEENVNKIADNYGRLFYRYGMNLLSIEYFNKNAGFDVDDSIYQMYQRNVVNISLLYDIYLYKNIRDNLPSFSSDTHIRENNMNGIKFIDSFYFSEGISYELGYSLALHRIIYISTNNYYIKINIQNIIIGRENHIMNQIISETPHYFSLGELVTTWNKDNNGIEMFGNDLINGEHLSVTATNWYNETERILNGIRIE